MDLSSQAVNEHGEQINKTGTKLNLNPSSISDFISNSQLCSYFSFSLSPCSKGSLSNHDGNGRGNVAQKLNSRCFKLHCYYLNSFNFQLMAIFFQGLNSKGLSLISQNFTSSIKREIRKFHVVVVQRWQRNLQKSVMHVQSYCFAILNLLLFSRSR